LGASGVTGGGFRRADQLSEAGVIQSPVVAANSIPGAVVLVFRDPDQIQLEFFTDPR
jgi:hypothetical protein